MTVTVVVGAQWGDEGKGKITNYYAREADYIVRFQGGNNAGHTIIINNRTYKFHLLPSGITYPDKTVILGNGMVIDPGVMLEELKALEEVGLPIGKIRISDRSALIMPYHKVQDALEEAMRGSAKIGTTRRGIGPAYTDKVARNTLRAGDLRDMSVFRDKLEFALKFKKAQFRGYMDYMDSAGIEYDKEAVEKSLDINVIVQEYSAYSDALKYMVSCTSEELAQAKYAGKNILLEGAQGTMLDLDHGTVPYVTSSNTVSGMATVGSGLGPMDINKVVGIAKVYTTRVGEGPFPTELSDRVSRHMAEEGHEFGTTTGRIRRCGWLDMVLLRYAVNVSSITHLALMKLDVLCGLDTVKVCTAYMLDGKKLVHPPSDAADLERVEPVYREFSGWDFDAKSIDVTKGVNALPISAQDFINYISKELNVKVDLISIGPERDETIDLRHEG